ncbi:hypothetical protein AFEL58S_00622 [Afipia felis]
MVRQSVASFSTAAASVSGSGVRMHQRLMNSSAKPESGPEFLRPGDRMSRHEVDGLGQMARHLARHRPLDGADVGDDRARFQMRCDFGGDVTELADRNADDHQIEILHRLDVRFSYTVADADLGGALADRRVAVGHNQFVRKAELLDRARDRGADMAEPDDGDAVELDGAHAAPMNSRSASTTRRLASSVPTLSRSACGSL